MKNTKLTKGLIGLLDFIMDRADGRIPFQENEILDKVLDSIVCGKMDPVASAHILIERATPYMTQDEQKKAYGILGREALSSNIPSIALRLLEKSDDPASLHDAVEACIEDDCVYFAMDHYSKSGDEEGIGRCLEKALENGETEGGTFQTIHQFYYMRWAAAKNKYLKEFSLENSRNTEILLGSDFVEIPCMAEKLAGEYDIGVSIADGGIATSLPFYISGLPMTFCKSQRHGKGAKFRWLGKPELEGKRVLVIDEDVVTGRTLKRVSREIQKYSPAGMDLFLQSGRCQKWSHLENVPDSFGRIIYPDHSEGNQRYDSFMRFVEKMRQYAEK